MGQLPEFPEFVPLDVPHREIVDSALASEQPEVSELNFAEIFAWHGVRQTQISDLEGALCLFITRHGKRCFYPPLQARDPVAAMLNMLRWLRERGEEGFVYGLTGRQAADAEATGELLTEEDPDNADYVYRTQDLIHLPGHRYDGKRNHIRNFMRSYDFTYAEIDPRSLPEVVDFQRRWFATRGRSDLPGLTAEDRAVHDLLRHYQDLPVTGATIRVDGRIEAFAIGSQLNRDTALVIVEKANSEIRGLYQAMNQMLCENTLSQYAWVNREQDAGDAGLRRAKLSYGPHHMVAKYRVRLAR
ncbi:MAG: phosphatidylglycerol lysyltransferase domain-containing protein [Polyangia bacterium]